MPKPFHRQVAEVFDELAKKSVLNRKKGIFERPPDAVAKLRGKIFDRATLVMEAGGLYLKLHSSKPTAAMSVDADGLSESLEKRGYYLAPIKKGIWPSYKKDVIPSIQ